eukprot:13218639-Heterocapsa_arctica.AAC.1
MLEQPSNMLNKRTQTVHKHSKPIFKTFKQQPEDRSTTVKNLQSLVHLCVCECSPVGRTEYR